MQPAPLDLLPSKLQVVCVLDPAILADANVPRLHAGAFSKDHVWRHLQPLMGAALEQMQYKCRVHKQSKSTMLKTTWTLIHRKDLLISPMHEEVWCNTQLLQQGHVSMRGNMCKTITHMISMVHAFTCACAM